MTSTNPTKPAQSATPVRTRFISQNSIRSQIEALLISARDVRDPITGESQVSVMMWHIVAAVMTMKEALDHDVIGAMSAQSAIRVGNTVIHVTTSPDWPLLDQCIADNRRGLRTLIISSHAGAAQAEEMAREIGIRRKIETLDITQFLVANMLEWTGFDGNQRRTTFEELITRYNAIVEDCETDKSRRASFVIHPGRGSVAA